MNNTITLPKPTPAMQQHCKNVKTYILQRIHQHHGKITFREYMNACLYAPGLGYYNNGMKKFGREGDFITAPEISPVFSHCLGHYFQRHGYETILEFGAGTGKMALDMLCYLEVSKQLPKKYFILEVSPELKQRQQHLFQQKAPQFLSTIEWLPQLPDKPFSGIIFANEILDSMPVHRFAYIDKELQECYVNENFQYQLGPLSDKRLYEEFLQLNLDPNDNYFSEINLMAKPWLNSLKSILTSGKIVLIDYGFKQSEYYHPERNQGTIMCHYQHYTHDDPFYLPGLQDITAHVNWTSIIRDAEALNLEIELFDNQANFLMQEDIITLASKLTLEPIVLSQQLQKLLMPHEMGELFKVLILDKQTD